MEGDRVKRIAMWSGPRNISTAMLRSWGNRADTIVCDEPLYAHYLAQTGLQHPGAADTLAAHESDWRAVVKGLTGPLSPGKTVSYQKHMAHHLLPQIELGWLDELSNCLLIREPKEMLTSLLEFLPEPCLADTGLPQQATILAHVRERTGQQPPIVDAVDVLNQPQEMLAKICQAVGVPFDEAMLSWPAGPRDTDGAWGKYWYEKVYQTTSFSPYRPKNASVPTHLQGLLSECEQIYGQLHQLRMRV